MANPPLQLGISQPLSIAPPTPAENKAKDELVVELRKQNQYETDEGIKLRNNLIRSLQKITEEFVRRAARNNEDLKGMNDKLLNSLGGKVTTYGGHPIGVYGPGSDIDVLVIAPKGITDKDFFEHYPTVLRERAGEAITALEIRSDAYVPIIAFDYHGVSIDLNFCEVKSPNVPSDFDVDDHNVLRGMTDTHAKSINGTRVASQLQKLVPEMAVFRTALKCIKLWAKQRGLYANIVGFPGGIAWAIMVAFICQLYPRAAASTIVLKFFYVLKSWPWPRPIMLKAIETYSLPFQVWGHRHNNDLMPVITPAYPAMCSTYNISLSTQEILVAEIHRGYEITTQILACKKAWKDLFVKHTFFTLDYKHYIAVIAASTTDAAQTKWKGRVLSRLRHLVKALEVHPSIRLARPYTSGFDRVHKCSTELEIEQVKEGFIVDEIKDVPTTMTDLSNDLSIFKAKQESSGDSPPETDTNGRDEEGREGTTVYTTTYYIGLELNKGAKSLDLKNQVQRYTESTKDWTEYSAQLSALHVRHVKATDLPADLFEEDEVRRSASRTNGTRKRAAIDETSNPTKRVSLAKPVA